MSKHGRKHKWWPVTATTAVLLAMSGGAVALLDGPGQAALTSGTAHLAPLTAARPSNGATVFGCVHSAGLRDIFDVSAVRHPGRSDPPRGLAGSADARQEPTQAEPVAQHHQSVTGIQLDSACWNAEFRDNDRHLGGMPRFRVGVHHV